ncbi:MAG: hypothetical protein AAF799_22445 [Myxococcota bacterium]
MSLVPALLGTLASVGAPVVEVGDHDPPQPIELRWDAPSSCPSSDAVRDEIATLLARSRNQGEAVRAEATVVPDGEAFRLRLSVVTRSGRDERSIRDPSCEPLAHATALVVATLMDPIAVSNHIEALTPADTLPREPPPSSLPEPPSTPPSSTETPPPRVTASDRRDDAPAPSPSPRTGVRPSLRLEGFVGAAIVPPVDGGLAFAVGMTRPQLRLELGAAYAVPQSRAHPVLADVGLQLQAFSGQARGCWVPATGAWEFPLCLAGEVGAMVARGQGSAVQNPTNELSLQLAALAEAHVAWRATERFALWLGAQGVLNLARPSFTVGTLAPFFTAPVGGGRAKLGIELRFP